VAAAQRELVHAEHGHALTLGIGQPAEQPQQGAAAYRQPQTLGSRAPARPASARLMVSSICRSKGLRLA
jgi:hypothetical protein